MNQIIPLIVSSLLCVLPSDSIFFPVGLMPMFEKPVHNGVPVFFVEPVDTCRVDSVVADDGGVSWYRIRTGAKRGWVRASGVLETGSRAVSLQKSGSQGKLDADTKRRYRLLEAHTDWPRRVVKLVREGNIGLDMTREQVAVSWGEPSQKGTAFILGAGEQELWYYRGERDTILVVFFNGGRVVGWSK